MQLLQNGLQPHSEGTPLFSMRTGSLASSQSGRSIDADAQCKRSLKWVLFLTEFVTSGTQIISLFENIQNLEVTVLAEVLY